MFNDSAGTDLPPVFDLCNAREKGVPVVLEQKTTILWKCLYLLASLQDSSDFVGRTRQTAEVRKKTLFVGKIPR
jgi:hypothetical protein